MASETQGGGERGPWYKNTTLIAGIFVIILGAGNWITGELRTTRHQAEALGLSDRQAGKAVSSEEIEIARTRMDFYHVVATGGRALTAFGLLLASLGLARQLRPQEEE